MTKNNPSKKIAFQADKEAEYKTQVEKARSEAKNARLKAKTAEKEKMRLETDLDTIRIKLEEKEAMLEEVYQSGADTQKELEELHASLSIVQSEIEEERKSRLEAEKAKKEIEVILEEIRKSFKAEDVKSLRVDMEKGGEQRATFILYVTFDEQGKLKRTLISHPQSDREETFPDFDTRRLSTFIQSCINIDWREKSPSPAAISGDVQKQVVTTPRTPEVNISISNVIVSRAGLQGEMALALGSNEIFNVEVHLFIQKVAAIPPSIKDLAIDITIYGQELTTGDRSTLAMSRDILLEQGPEQIVRMQVTGLFTGIYRLVTKAILHGPYRSISFYEGPFIQVLEFLPTSHPNA